LAFYVLDSNSKFIEENDSQPEVLLDDSTESLSSYPKSIPLMLSKEKMKRRNVRKVLRYHTPNAATNAEAYSHHLLMLFFPFRKETELLSEVDKSYFSKLNQPDILAVVNINKEKFEPWGDLVETSLRNFTFQSRTDNYAQQENDDVLDELDEQIE